MNGQHLSDRQFARVASFIQDGYGIKMTPSKRTMVSSRLQKRMKHTGFDSLEDYVDFVFSPEGIEYEIVHMVDAVTTNKTDFFREARHFEILRDMAIPEILSQKRRQGDRKIRIWSAACSSGEEPYSIAITLAELAKQKKELPLPFSILASDISTKVLKKAARGIYDESRISDIPMQLRVKYLLRSKDRGMRLVKIKPCLRDLVTFRRINLMSEHFEIKEKIDIIFCRNVLIYFDNVVQRELMHRFARCLTPQGFLFIGHSESLNVLNVPFNQVIPTVYQKKI